MPELPEVETIRRGLERGLLSRRIRSAEVWETRLRKPLVENEVRSLIRCRVDAVGRRGKYLLLALDDGRTWLVHLGMSGRLLMDRSAGDRSEHEHFRVVFEGGEVLHYVDPRRFGATRVGRVEDFEELRGLGPEPLEAPGGFLAPLRRTRREVKTALLDQRLVAGIGNIYASEILFRAAIRPTRRGIRLRWVDVDRIETETRRVLLEAVERRGTSISDYFDADGRPGTFQTVLSVFDRSGAECPRCSGKICRIVQTGRSSFFCPGCQR